MRSHRAERAEDAARRARPERLVERAAAFVGGGGGAAASRCGALGARVAHDAKVAAAKEAAAARRREPRRGGGEGQLEGSVLAQKRLYSGVDAAEASAAHQVAAERAATPEQHAAMMRSAAARAADAAKRTRAAAASAALAADESEAVADEAHRAIDERAQPDADADTANANLLAAARRARAAQIVDGR